MATLRQPTFAEREGTKRLPSQLQLGEVSTEIRARVWECIHASIQSDTYQNRVNYNNYTYNWGQILKDCWVRVDHRFVDAFNTQSSSVLKYAKEKMSVEYSQFLEFIEFVAQHPKCPGGLVTFVNAIFEECGCAYRVIDSTVVPVSSSEMAATVERAFHDVSGFAGARSHLNSAADHLTRRAFADSVRESIHAVESVARKISPDSQTLGPALNEIGKTTRMHPALKKGFSALYGYTSDENGIRHSLIDESNAQVTEAEALYMLGSCSAFISYLIAADRARN